MSYVHLKPEERYVIHHLKLYGLSLREIGRRLNRSVSTISRELKRNTGQYQEVYWYEDAQNWAEQRRRQTRLSTKKADNQLYGYVVTGLRAGWSPQLISGRMRKEYPRHNNMCISTETLYRWVYRDAVDGGELYKLLPRHHKRRKRHRGRFKHIGRIKDRVGIENRPEIVNSRSRYGDWESDTLEGAKGKGGLATHVERKSRYLVAARVKDKTSQTYTKQTSIAFREIPHRYLKTMTADNGKEFSGFKHIEQNLGVKVYFADPYSAWQRATNENTNGLLRRYFPKGFDFNSVSNYLVNKVVNKLNNRPRKCLDYRTPREALFKLPTVAFLM
jgi:transposase, IS30 family